MSVEAMSHNTEDTSVDDINNELPGMRISKNSNTKPKAKALNFEEAKENAKNEKGDITEVVLEKKKKEKKNISDELLKTINEKLEKATTAQDFLQILENKEYASFDLEKRTIAAHKWITAKCSPKMFPYECKNKNSYLQCMHSITLMSFRFRKIWKDDKLVETVIDTPNYLKQKCIAWGKETNLPLVKQKFIKDFETLKYSELQYPGDFDDYENTYVETFYAIEDASIILAMCGVDINQLKLESIQIGDQEPTKITKLIRTVPSIL
uniref:Uncharacterized protein n=1 Tax=viral metagenome TaxID=1070528 RepID=A0A6C0JTH1_9ZZZZ